MGLNGLWLKEDPNDLRVDKSDEQWRAELDPEQYAVLREAATERPVDR